MIRAPAAERQVAREDWWPAEDWVRDRPRRQRSWTAARRALRADRLEEEVERRTAVLFAGFVGW